MTEKTVSRMNYWLMSANVRFKQGVTEKLALVNVVLATSEQYLNSGALGRVNQMAQVQAVNTGLIPNNGEITGVIIISANFIGQMSDEEFNAQLAEPLAMVADEGGDPVSVASVEGDSSDGVSGE